MEQWFRIWGQTPALQRACVHVPLYENAVRVHWLCLGLTTSNQTKVGTGRQRLIRDSNVLKIQHHVSTYRTHDDSKYRSMIDSQVGTI